jgi:hypothetical protein
MLTNLTEMDITEVYIAPSVYPDYQSENLLNTNLESQTRLYIGPNYYGDQAYWNITLKWSNGYTHTFTRARLTRYNSYVVWTNYYGVHLRQSYERAYARYSQGQMPSMYGGGMNGVQVYVGVPEKINIAQNTQQNRNPLVQQRQEQQPPAQNEYQQPAQQDDQASAMANLRTPKRTTRDLVFDDEDEEEASPPAVEGTTSANVAGGEKTAVKATVELTRDGATTTVLPTEPFRTGDKVRLLFSANRNGYVYWVTKGTSGQYQVLFPTAKAGQDNAIDKNVEYTVPSKGSWRFDDNQGTETLVCLISPDRIADLDFAIEKADAGDKSVSSAIVAGLVDGHEEKRTTRDLVFEEEDEGDVNTKTQITKSDDVFVATYELEHS